jgi:hypothetical protein
MSDIQGNSRISKTVGRVAVAIRVGIGSYFRHSGEAAELVGP